MLTKLKDTIHNEKGFMLVVVVLMLAVLTVIGIAATTTSDIELQIAGNEKQLVNDFYNVEGGLIYVLEDVSNWMTDDFLTAGETVASYWSDADFDSDGAADAMVEVRCIECSGAPCTGTTIDELSDAGNDLPAMPHVAPPPIGSGYGMKYFEARRYGATSTSKRGNIQVQVGTWRAFNKF